MLEHSRSLLLAEGATGRKRRDLERQLEDSRVLISVDSSIPGAVLTGRTLLTILRRGPGRLVLVRDDLPASAVEEFVEAAHVIDSERPIEVVTGIRGAISARVHVGTSCSDQAIRIAPDGFGAHIAGQRSAKIRIARASNPLGAIYSAALGAAEVFKVTARVLPTRRILHRHLRHCPVSLSADLEAAHDLIELPAIAMALIGVGAIGTGIVLLLKELGMEGSLLAVDNQQFRRENIGTYSIGGAAEVRSGMWKVDIAHAVLSRFDVRRFPKPVEELASAIDGQTMPWFPLTIAALDTPEARRATQRLWPDRLIDAATGDTMLGLNEYIHGQTACMMCLFPQRYDGPSAAEELSYATGLPIERLRRGDDPLTEADLSELGEDQRRQLEPHIGKPVCGLADAFGLTSLNTQGYSPAVPFISLQAACLAVGRLFARLSGSKTAGSLVQYDSFIGPQAATIETMVPVTDCYCQQRAKVVDTVRTMRRGMNRRDPHRG